MGYALCRNFRLLLSPLLPPLSVVPDWQRTGPLRWSVDSLSPRSVSGATFHRGDCNLSQVGNLSLRLTLLCSTRALSPAGWGYSPGSSGSKGPRPSLTGPPSQWGRSMPASYPPATLIRRVDTYSYSAGGPDLLVGLVLADAAGVPLVAGDGDLLQPRVLCPPRILVGWHYTRPGTRSTRPTRTCRG